MADDSGVLSDAFVASSSFGTNYDGSVDTQDNGEGRWGANTRDPVLKGVALPESVVREKIGDPKDPDVKAAINSGKYQVEVTTSGGRTGLYPVVDMGPAPWTGRGIDLTGGAARDLGLNDNSFVHYQLRKKDDSASQQTKEEASPIAQLRLKYPQYANITDEKLIDTIYGTDPKFKKIDQKQFAQYMKSPTGGKAIQDAIAKGETPIQKFRDKYPQYGTLTDDQVALKLLPIVQKKEPQMTLEGLKDRLNPKPADDNWALNWGKTIAEVGIEAVKQIPAQSVDVIGSAWRGVSEINQKGAQDEINKLLPTLGQGLTQDQWLAMTPDQREAKLFGSGATRKPLWGEGSADPRSQDFLVSLGQLDKNLDVQKANAWMAKVVGDVDQNNKGPLPAEQEQAAKTIAQAPAATLLQLFPGMRELANYGMLYDQNRKYLEGKNPALGADKINDMAMKMADQQFPAQETLGLIMARGGGALTAGITNKIVKAGAEVVLAGGTGAGVFTSNQLIRNIGSGDDWTKDLGESAFEGSLLGGVGAGTRLTFGGIKTLLSTSRDGKAASGTLQAVTQLDPKESNDFVNGGTENAVAKKIDGTAIDLGIDAAKSQPLVDVVRHAVEGAEEARANGDTKTAAMKFDQGLSLMDDASRQKVADTVQQSVKAIAQKDPLPTQTKITGWQELKPWQTAADVPEGAETKVDPSGKTFWKAGATKTEEVKQPDLSGFYGLKDPETGKEDDIMYSGLNPFAAARDLKTALGNIPGWKKLQDNLYKLTAPQRRGEMAAGTATLGKGIRADEKTASNMLLKVLAEETGINKLYKGGDWLERMERYFHKYSNPELADMTSKVERGEKIGRPIDDQIFDFVRKSYDEIGKGAKTAGIKMGWVENYIRHSLKDDAKDGDAINRFNKMWAKPSFTKTRDLPTVNDVLAAGLELKNYNPIRNLMGYEAGVRNARAEVRHLKDMAKVGLAYEVGKAPEIAENWKQIDTPDGKHYVVSPEQVQVLSNMYNVSSVQDTIAGPLTSFAGAVKGFSQIKLALSFFHPGHVSGVDVAQAFSNVQYGIKQRGRVTGKDFMDALAAPIHPVLSQFKYGHLRDIMSGEASKEEIENISDKDRTDLRDVVDGGMVVNVSHERQMQWTAMLTRNVSKLPLGRQAAETARVGYKYLLAEPIQKIIFGKYIPNMKLGAYLARRDLLLQEHPDLYDPKNHLFRSKELEKIGWDIEGRYGEMFMDNLLWHPIAKQIGVSFPLSLGWNLGFWRIHGDAIVDLTDNVLHMDQIGKEVSKNREWVTERMLYAANYNALACVFCGTLTASAAIVLKQKWDSDWKDYFFPRIGTKPNGEAERVRTPFFNTEIASMLTHMGEESQKAGNPAQGVAGGMGIYAINKLNPGLMAMYEWLRNKDYRGREVHDPTDEPIAQMEQSFVHFAKALGLPMSLENLADPSMPHGPKEVITGFLGLNPAPAWTGRTGLENKIFTEYVRENEKVAGKSGHAGKIADAKKAYEAALQSGDASQVQAARNGLEALKDPFFTEAKIKAAMKDSEKNFKSKVPVASRLFKMLWPEEQDKMLKGMNPEERKEFLPYAHKEVKKLYAGSLSQ